MDSFLLVRAKCVGGNISLLLIPVQSDPLMDKFTLVQGIQYISRAKKMLLLLANASDSCPFIRSFWGCHGWLLQVMQAHSTMTIFFPRIDSLFTKGFTDSLTRVLVF